MSLNNRFRLGSLAVLTTLALTGGNATAQTVNPEQVSTANSGTPVEIAPGIRLRVDPAYCSIKTPEKAQQQFAKDYADTLELIGFIAQVTGNQPSDTKGQSGVKPKTATLNVEVTKTLTQMLDGAVSQMPDFTRGPLFDQHRDYVGAAQKNPSKFFAPQSLQNVHATLASNHTFTAEANAIVYVLQQRAGCSNNKS